MTMKRGDVQNLRDVRGEAFIVLFAGVVQVVAMVAPVGHSRVGRVVITKA